MLNKKRKMARSWMGMFGRVCTCERMSRGNVARCDGGAKHFRAPQRTVAQFAHSHRAAECGERARVHYQATEVHKVGQQWSKAGNLAGVNDRPVGCAASNAQWTLDSRFLRFRQRTISAKTRMLGKGEQEPQINAEPVFPCLWKDEHWTLTVIIFVRLREWR